MVLAVCKKTIRSAVADDDDDDDDVIVLRLSDQAGLGGRRLNGVLVDDAVFF